MAYSFDNIPSNVKTCAAAAVLSALILAATDRLINEDQQHAICQSFKEQTQAALADDYDAAIKALENTTSRFSILTDVKGDFLDTSPETVRLHVYYNVNSSELDPSVSTIWGKIGLGFVGAQNCYATLISEPVQIEYGDIEFKADF